MTAPETVKDYNNQNKNEFADLQQSIGTEIQIIGFKQKIKSQYVETEYIYIETELNLESIIKAFEKVNQICFQVIPIEIKRYKVKLIYKGEEKNEI